MTEASKPDTPTRVGLSEGLGVLVEEEETMDKVGFSLEPDPWMRWIYDHRDPRYHSDEARDLRDRRAAALRSCPQWMLDSAALNDELLKTTPNVRAKPPSAALQEQR